MNGKMQITEQNAPAFRLTDEECLKVRPDGRNGLTLTRERCHAMGVDAANRQMQKAGRKAWNDEDYDLAVRVQMHHIVLGGFLPPEVYQDHCGEPFPYVRGNDGSWIKLNPRTRTGGATPPTGAPTDGGMRG